MEQLVAHAEKKLDQVSLSQPCRLLRSIPGVGPRLAEIAVAMIDNPRRFRSGKQVASYGGLRPRQHQSGAQDRQGRISRMGNNLLRALLVEIGWIGLRYNPWMRDVYERVRRGSPVRKKQAIVAVARRFDCEVLGDAARWHHLGGAIAFRRLMTASPPPLRLNKQGRPIRLAVAPASVIVKAEATARRTGRRERLDLKNTKRDGDRSAKLWGSIPFMTMSVVA